MADDKQLEDTLVADRPAPRAAYRGVLRRHLLAIGTPSSRPANLRGLVVGFALTGAGLLFIGVLSVAGLGPLAS